MQETKSQNVSSADAACRISLCGSGFKILQQNLIHAGYKNLSGNKMIVQANRLIIILPLPGALNRNFCRVSFSFFKNYIPQQTFIHSLSK